MAKKHRKASNRRSISVREVVYDRLTLYTKASEWTRSSFVEMVINDALDKMPPPALA